MARVLIVDDSPDNADALALLAETLGHTARAAYAGPEALSAAAEFRPHVALLDLAMPGMDGLELAARLRALPDLEPLLLVAVTGYGQPEDRLLTARAGFDAHLLKPCDPESVRRILNAAEAAAAP
jgi:CheY-like chemotaxis protein